MDPIPRPQIAVIGCAIRTRESHTPMSYYQYLLRRSNPSGPSPHDGCFHGRGQSTRTDLDLPINLPSTRLRVPSDVSMDLPHGAPEIAPILQNSSGSPVPRFRAQAQEFEGSNHSGRSRRSRPVELMWSAYDAVVIGSGYGGGIASLRMAKQSEGCSLNGQQLCGNVPTGSRCYSSKHSTGVVERPQSDIGFANKENSVTDSMMDSGVKEDAFNSGRKPYSSGQQSNGQDHSEVDFEVPQKDLMFQTNVIDNVKSKILGIQLDSIDTWCLGIMSALIILTMILVRRPTIIEGWLSPGFVLQLVFALGINPILDYRGDARSAKTNECTTRANAIDDSPFGPEISVSQ